MYGSNGHRVHWCATDRPDGLYCPKTFEPVELDNYPYTFPNFQRIAKGYFGQQGQIFSENNKSALIPEDSPNQKLWCYDYRTQGKGSVIQKPYLDHALTKKDTCKFYR